MLSVLTEIDKLDWLREQIIGRNKIFESPFGEKPLVYVDYTASGRGFYPIENQLLHMMEFYANTHTEDDISGCVMTNLLHDAENKIKEIVNAGTDGKIIFNGTGATGAITRLQMLLGVFIPSATRLKMKEEGLEPDKSPNKPVVFVGPYEHHTNELSWRFAHCDIVVVPIGEDGYFDLGSLEKLLKDSKYSNRQKIGAFSAGSNVTGILSPVYEIARILHENGAIACFDFAAVAPYVEIDMNKDEKSYFDAVFFSPHKFLGGPGSAGVLIFNDKIYNKDLPPTIAGGGTVDYVTDINELFTADVETREKPGTPGSLQAIKVALVMELKDKVGNEKIEEIEKYFAHEFNKRYKNNDNLVIYGPDDPNKKVAIISFNIKHQDRFLHHKFVTRLFNDLFGIQTRAGCSCAGPYGRYLLDIPLDRLKLFTDLIENNIFGVKPGWARLNLHYSLSVEEFNFIMDALDFVIENGYKFLPLYEFDLQTGSWVFKNNTACDPCFPICLDTIMKTDTFKNDKITKSDSEIYEEVLKEAKAILSSLNNSDDVVYYKFDDDIDQLVRCYAVNVINSELKKNRLSGSELNGC